MAMDRTSFSRQPKGGYLCMVTADGQTDRNYLSNSSVCPCISFFLHTSYSYSYLPHTHTHTHIISHHTFTSSSSSSSSSLTIDIEQLHPPSHHQSPITIADGPPTPSTSTSGTTDPLTQDGVVDSSHYGAPYPPPRGSGNH